MKILQVNKFYVTVPGGVETIVKEYAELLRNSNPLLFPGDLFIYAFVFFVFFPVSQNAKSIRCYSLS